MSDSVDGPAPVDPTAVDQSKPACVDDLDRHLARAGSIERAAVPMGMYLAWCANLELLAPAFQRDHEAALLRLRYRDSSPVEFLTATCGGRLEESVFSEAGLAFTRWYYPRLLDDFAETFLQTSAATSGADPYAVENDWPHYDQIAAVLTRRYLGEFKGLAKSDSSQGRKWWQFWR